jgi:hypothetical protein
MDPAARKYIESVQPYHHPTRIQEHVAHTLSRLNNADKHRQELIQIRALIPQAVELTDIVGQTVVIPTNLLPLHTALPDGTTINFFQVRSR